MNNLHQLPTISSLLRDTLPHQLHNVEITRKFENFQIDKRKFLKSANVKCVFTRSLVFTHCPVSALLSECDCRDYLVSILAACHSAKCHQVAGMFAVLPFSTPLMDILYKVSPNKRKVYRGSQDDNWNTSVILPSHQ